VKGHASPADPRAQQAERLDPRRWLALALLGTAFFMVILDGTIVYTALPVIGGELEFSPKGLQWVMSAYLLCFGGLLLLGGRTADLLGRRRVFMVGVALFLCSSLLCGLAWSPGALIGARVVQGVSAAIMAPTALSLLMTVFAEGPERNKALGIWGGIGGVGATTGLLVGGLIVDSLGWEWIFFVNVPVGAALLILSPRLLPESVDPDCPPRFDIAGAATVTAALVLLIYAITGAPAAGWTSLRTVALLTASACLLALFGVIEARSRGPLVPLRIFRSSALIGGNLVLLTAGMSVDGVLLLLTLYAQGVLGYSTVQFGLMTAVMTVSSVVGAYTAQAVATRTSFRWVGVAGMALVGTACLLLTRVSVDGSYWPDLFFGLLIFGSGLGAAFVASQIAALAGVAEEESGLAAGLVDSSFNIGGALGIAVLSTVAVAGADDALAGAGRASELEAQTEGFQAAFASAVAIAALGVLLALALFRAKAPSEGEALAAKAAPLAGCSSIEFGVETIQLRDQ
jgi:EmrB/QacA subfamily drug resistance transporter